MATVALEDFVKPFYPNILDRKATILTKLIAVGYGIIIIALSFACEPLGGVFSAATKALGAMDGHLLEF